MFLLAGAVQIGSEADLGLDLFLAIAVIVVRDDGDHYAAFIAASHLEGPAGVIRLVFAGPAHAVALLPFASFGYMRKSNGGFANPHQVRRQQDTTRVSGPVQRVEPGVILRKVWI